MVDLVKLSATAQRLIAANGRNVTLRQTNATLADPTEPWRGPDATATPTDVVAPAFSFPFELKDVDGTNVRVKDQQMLVAQADLGSNEIKSFDVVVDDGVWEIVNVKTIKPGNTAIIHTLHLRQ